MLVGQRPQLLLERREQRYLHDPQELIQLAGNGKLHAEGNPSTLELVLVNPILKMGIPALNDPTALILQVAPLMTIKLVSEFRCASEIQQRVI